MKLPACLGAPEKEDAKRRAESEGLSSILEVKRSFQETLLYVSTLDICEQSGMTILQEPTVGLSNTRKLSFFQILTVYSTGDTPSPAGDTQWLPFPVPSAWLLRSKGPLSSPGTGWKPGWLCISFPSSLEVPQL